MNWILITISILIALRLLLPFAVLYFANRSLGKMKGFRGDIKRIAIQLINGTFSLHEIHLNEVDTITKVESTFLTASTVSLSIQWKQLFRKSMVGDILIYRPKIQLRKDKAESATTNGSEKNEKATVTSTSSLKKMLQDIMPFNFNLTINIGEVHYTDPAAKPVVDIALTGLEVAVSNFSNMAKNTLPATLYTTAHVYEGTLDFNMKLIPMAEQLTFDLNMELKDINMVLLNDFFRAYAKIDVSKGTFGMYTEVAAKEGKFKGYVKPVLKDLDITGAEDKNDSIFRKLWEGFVGVIVQVLENNKSDQIATKIPIEGNLNDPHINIIKAVTGILKNAFIRAIQPSFDNSINISSVMKSVAEGTKEFAKGLFHK